MRVKPRVTRPGIRRTRTLAAAVLLLAGALGVSLPSASAAQPRTTASGTTLVANLALDWGPNTDSPTGGTIADAGSSVYIQCYATGQSVSGPYGTENIWDYAGPGQPAGPDEIGVGWLPDADVYTGSNSAVVPACSSDYDAAASGQTIGGTVTVYDYPGGAAVASIPSGEDVEIQCYTTGPGVSGPYGSENIWDLLIDTYYSIYEYVPDALVYTGSNSAVVPECEE
jgi:uncharacterized protein YraI